VETFDDLPMDGVDSVADALLQRWHQEDASLSSASDEEKDKTARADEDHEDANELSDTEASEDEEDGNEGQEAEEDNSEDDKRKVVAEDDLIRKIKVDGKEIEVSVKSLERLYGQEQALDRKNKEVAQQRARIEEESQRYSAATKALLDRAVERYKPYENANWLVLSKQLDEDALAALTTEAQKAYSDVQFLQTELDGHLKQTQELRNKEYQERAQATAKALNDPKSGIPNFREVYPKMVEYAIEQGLPQEIINREVDERTLRILHKAYMYDLSKSVATKPVSKQPKKVIKGNVNTEATRTVTKNNTKVTKRVMNSTEDIANAFLNRWSSDN
jgi:hypothetical protein